MNIIDEIKLALWAKSLPAELNKLGGTSKMGAKISGMLAKLDGLKSVVGLLMVVAYYAGPQFGVAVPAVVLKIGSSFASLGLAMKLEKGAGLLTSGISYAQKGLGVLQAVVNSLAAKQNTPKA